MNKIKILDVTLRDGGYKNNFDFSYENAKIIVEQLNKVNIDFIEIGYKNGSFKTIDNIGITGISDEKYISFLTNECSNSNLGLIYHPKNVELSDIKALKSQGIKFLRCCMDLKNLDKSLSLIEETKQQGLMSFVNLTRVSSLNDSELIKIIKLINLCYVDVIYVADSNGNMMPQDVMRIINLIKNNMYKSVEIGFHAHNNLGLAVANSVAAIESGANFIDSSLLGMGKGSGNLNTEFITVYLNKYFGLNKYKIGSLLALTDWFRDNVFINPVFKNIDYIMGYLNLSADELEKASNLAYSYIDSAC